MSDVTDTFEDAHESLRRYEARAEHFEEEPEKWKKDHKAAMRCWKLESLLANGLSLYDYINRIDEAWRKRMFRKEVKYNPDMDRLVAELYRWWYKACPRILDRLKEMEKHFDVAGAEEFRVACREVQGILTPDEEFFVGDRLIKLRDRAVDSHRRGQTEEMESMTD